MNMFDYTLKIKELSRLTTKKDKENFIREAKTGIGGYRGADILSVKLLLEIQANIPDTIRGVKSIPMFIAGINFDKFSYKDKVELVKILPKEKVTATNDYHAFMHSSGIPAYLKLAVLQAQQKEINER